MMLILLLSITLIVFYYQTYLIMGCKQAHLDKYFSEKDLFGEQMQGLHLKIRKIAGNEWTLPVVYCFLIGLFDFGLNYLDFFHSANVRNFNLVILIILVWKAISYKKEINVDRSWMIKKLVLFVFAVSVYISPCFLPLFIFIYITYFKGWLHHDQMAVRILKMNVAISIAIIFIKSLGLYSATEIFDCTMQCFYILIFTLIGSHYIMPGFSKLKIGRKWYSWLLEDQLQYLFSSAYAWGWLKFIPENNFLKLFRVVKKMAPVLKFYSLFAECGCLFMLLNVYITNCLLCMLICFHIGIFMFSGLLFLGNICCLLSACIFLLFPLTDHSYLFNSTSFFLSFLIALFPLTKNLWFPYKLTWWNSPLVGRIHWRAVGESGTIYGLYNGFFSPYDRLFGRFYGFFLTYEKILYFHLGEVFDYKVRNQIILSKGKKEAIENLKENSGRCYRDAGMEEKHDFFIKEFVGSSNKNFQSMGKYLFLRKLSFPYGQWYLWGKNPAYNYQEKIKKVLVYFTEEYMNGEEFITQKDYFIKSIDI